MFELYPCEKDSARYERSLEYERANDFSDYLDSLSDEDEDEDFELEVCEDCERTELDCKCID